MPSILQTQRDIIERLERLTFGGCCPDNVSLFDDVIETDLTPGVGDPPATWGDQPVADWSEWYHLLCGASYRYADYLIASANQAQVVVSQGAYTLAIIAAILSLLSGAGLLVVIAYGTAAAGLNAVIQVAGTAVFADAATAFAANRDRIVCGVRNDNLRQEVESILSPAAWLFYQYVQWENATNILWEGGIPGGLSLDDSPGAECPDCSALPDQFGVDFLGHEPNQIGTDCNHARWPDSIADTSRIVNGVRCSDNSLIYGGAHWGSHANIMLSSTDPQVVWQRDMDAGEYHQIIMGSRPGGSQMRDITVRLQRLDGETWTTVDNYTDSYSPSQVTTRTRNYTLTADTYRVAIFSTQGGNMGVCHRSWRPGHVT